MLRKSLVFILIIPLALSCHRSKNSDATIIEINPADTSQYGFSKYFELEKHVVLETSSASVMQDIRKIIIANEKIFILTWGEPQVLIFDTDGKFLSQINKYGRGPGEYTYVVDMSVSIEGDTICLYDKSLKKIMKYNQSGDFLSSVDINLDLESFAILQSGNIIGYSFLNRVMPLNDTLFQLWFFDPSGKIIAGRMPIRKDNMGDSFGSPSSINSLASGTYFIPYTENAIYKITENPFQTRLEYRFDFGEKTMPLDMLEMPRQERQEAFDKSFILSGEYVGSRSILVNIFSRKEMISQVAIYNLKKKTYSLINRKSLWDESNELPISTNMQNTYHSQDRLIAVVDVLRLHTHSFIDNNSLGFEIKQNMTIGYE